MVRQVGLRATFKLSHIHDIPYEMPTIKYYYSPGSCSLAPHILLRDIGAEFEAIRLSDLRLHPLPEEFRRINPKMRVPVMSVDDDTITELPAIVTMIASFAPERKLLGRTQLETVRVYEWMNWLSGTAHSLGYKLLFRPMHYTTNLAGCDGIKAKARELVTECFELLEQKLAGPYAVGGALTVVDPYLLVFYRWGSEIGLNMKEKYPKYTALVENLVQLAPVKSTLEIEEIESTL